MGIVERLEMPEDKFIARSEANIKFCLEVLQRHGVDDFVIGMTLEEKKLETDSTGLPVHDSWNRIREYDYRVLQIEEAREIRKIDPYFEYINISNIEHYLREKTFIPSFLDIEMDIPEKDKDFFDSEKNLDYFIGLLRTNPIEEQHKVQYVITVDTSRPLEYPHRYHVRRDDHAEECSTHWCDYTYFGLQALEDIKRRYFKTSVTAEEVFATLAWYCNSKLGFSAIGSAKGMPQWEDLWKYTFIPSITDYIFLEEKTVEKPSNHDFGLNCTRMYDYVDHQDKLYRIPWHNEWRENPEVKALLAKVKASTEALREEFEKALRRRMKRPDILIAGFRDLFDKDKLEAFAKKRQGKVVGKEYEHMTHTYYYDDSGHLDAKMTNEERREFVLLASFMGTHTYCYFMSMNIPY